jgi:hypothetical protein
MIFNLLPVPYSELREERMPTPICFEPVITAASIQRIGRDEQHEAGISWLYDCRRSILPRSELLCFPGTETAEVPEHIVIGAVVDPVSERAIDRLAIAGEAQM